MVSFRSEERYACSEEMYACLEESHASSEEMYACSEKRVISFGFKSKVYHSRF